MFSAPSWGQDPGEGDKVDTLIDEVVKTNKDLADTQGRIDAASDTTEDLLAEWRAVQRRNRALRAYNDQIQTLVDAQNKELDGIRKQIEKVMDISREMTPLMLRMLDGLEKFIELDIPFLLDERKNRIAELRTLMDRADVAESEKFRRLLEAYQIENEFGRTIEAYRGEVPSEGGEKATVDILRIGRIALLYLDLGGSKGGMYDSKTKTWKPVSPQQARAIKKGLRMARKQVAPDLIRIPVPAPLVSKRIDVEEAMKR